MKKILCIFLSAICCIALAACGSSGGNSGSSGDGGGGGGGSQSDSAQVPEGLYMFMYYCNEDGEYVKEANEITDYEGYPTTELQTLYDQKVTYWCDIKDGTGPMEEANYGSSTLTFHPEEGALDVDSSVSMIYDYHYDPEADAFWYGDGDYHYYM